MTNDDISPYPQIRMEEADIGSTADPGDPQVGFELDDPEPREDLRRRLSGIDQLLRERHHIIDDDNLSPKERLRLLENNRRTIIVATGGTIRGTENVVYAILAFGGCLVVILALLTVFADLPSEITLTFVGTVLGGTIATIAQKVSKI